MNQHNKLQLNTIDNLQGLIDSETQESLHLEYKRSLALTKKEVTKLQKMSQLWLMQMEDR